MLLIEFSPNQVNKLFSYRSSKPLIFGLKTENNLLDFDFCEFVLQPLKKGKVTVRIIPKVVGTFRVLAIFFRVFNIPRFFTFDNEFNSMKHFLLYVHDMEQSLENAAAINPMGDYSKFVNRVQEMSSVNCEINRLLRSE